MARIRIFGKSSCAHLERSRPVRVTLLPGQIARLNPRCARVRVVTGTAYISRDQEDIVLQRGEDVTVQRGRYNALISAAGRAPLVLEVAS
jgi:hypothetical protein